MAPLPLALPDDWLRRCWVLAGPTAAGKTAIGLQLAERIGAEILCLDSMTLYRGLDIGTAKPTLEERARVPHHLLDRLDPHEECSVADYLEMARDAVADVFSRGRIPLFVGGSGMYLRALLRGLCASPPGDEKLRAEIAAWADAISPEALHAELRAADPAAAALSDDLKNQIVPGTVAGAICGKVAKAGGGS